jgi:hypothetical protein
MALAAQTTRSFPIEQADFESAVYVKKTDRLYAAIGDLYQRENTNSILEMDPARGTILNTYTVGFKPSLIRASRDEQYLFFVTEGPATLKRFNLNTKRLDWGMAVPAGLLYKELREVPGSGQRWILSILTRDSAYLSLIDVLNNTTFNVVWPTQELVNGFDFKNDSTLIAWQGNIISEMKVRRRGLVVSKQFKDLPGNVNQPGFLIGDYLVLQNKLVLNLSSGVAVREEGTSISRSYFFSKDPQSGDLITIDRLLNEQDAHINRYSPRNLSLLDSWKASYPNNIFPFETFRSDLSPFLVYTGTDRYIFKGVKFTQIAWKCNSSLPKPTISGPKTHSFCSGDSVVLRPDRNNIADLVWNNGSKSPNLTAIETGQYAVRYADDRGCYTPFSDSIKVDVLPGSSETFNIGTWETNSASSVSICRGAKIEIRAIPRFFPDKKWVWSTGSNERVLTVGAGNYWVAGISDQGCLGTKYGIEITSNRDTVPPKPQIRILSNNGALNYCLGEQAIFETDFAPNFFYDWNGFLDIKNQHQRSVFFLDGPVKMQQRVRVGPQFTCLSEYSDPINIVFNPRPTTPQIRLDNNQLISNQAGAHQWFLNGKILDNAVGSSIPTQGGGFYTAKFLVNGCTSQISNAVAVGGKTTATRDQSRSIELKIQPNPVLDELHVQLEASTNNNTLAQIISLDGKLILEQKIQIGATGKVQIPAANLVKGIYLLRIREENVQYWGRFVKQ